MKMSKMLAVVLSLLIAFAMAPSSFAGEEQKPCPRCGKEIQATTNTFHVVYKDGKEASFGCPGCGLSGMKSGLVKSAHATDLLRGTMIDASKAYYLKGADFGTCCAPYWLSFSSKEEAKKFAKGFGGKVMSYEEALKEVDAQP